MSSLIAWIFRNVKIDVKTAIELIKDCDKDSDEFISIGEFIDYVKMFAKKK